MPGGKPDKPLMRCIGEFFGHIFRAVRHDVNRSRIIEEEHREEKRGTTVIRETRIREIEVREDEHE